MPFDLAVSRLHLLLKYLCKDPQMQNKDVIAAWLMVTPNRRQPKPPSAGKSGAMLVGRSETLSRYNKHIVFLKGKSQCGLYGVTIRG